MAVVHGAAKPWVCYSNGCREPECRDGWRVYQRDQWRQRHRPDGVPPAEYVDAKETRDYLRWLSSKGVGVTQISRITGIHRSTVQKIRSGKTTKVQPRIENKILGVHLGRVKVSKKSADCWPNAGEWSKKVARPS